MINEQLISILQEMDLKKEVKFRIDPLTVVDIHGVHVVNNKSEDIIVLENARLKKGKYD